MNDAVYARLRTLYEEIKNQTDLSAKSLPFFKKTIQEVRVELLKVAATLQDQIPQDVTDAMRLIHIMEREEIKNVNDYQNYQKEIPKHMARAKETLLVQLAFLNKGTSKKR
jgi:hypothetical protein